MPAMLMVLGLNNVLPHYTQAELIQLGLDTANGQAKYGEILDWIVQHRVTPHELPKQDYL